ncbi:MAG TPA: phospho-N-acetylmuramoyl-pentapeptide-transferase, partial [Verrucomicrobiae bacterium]|nr:phospho-N-acetylmuramoyl-pentapeptide-transferase [Verrucomicrobiae bacterium]
MLELLGQLEDQSQFFNLFNYITFRTGGAMFTAMVIAFAIGAPFIAWLRKKQGKGQPIRTDGPEGHLLTKKGTPTMGGLIILISLGISSLLWADLQNPYVWAVLLVTLSFGTIGFIDDFAKVTKQHHGGLSAKVRLGAEFGTALLAVIIMLVAEWVATTPGQTHDVQGFFNALMHGDPLTAVALPFVQGWGVQLLGFYIIFAMIVITGFGNAVNLTDGLDGLAIVPVMIAAATFGMICYLVGRVDY